MRWVLLRGFGVFLAYCAVKCSEWNYNHFVPSNIQIIVNTSGIVYQLVLLSTFPLLFWRPSYQGLQISNTARKLIQRQLDMNAFGLFSAQPLCPHCSGRTFGLWTHVPSTSSGNSRLWRHPHKRIWVNFSWREKNQKEVNCSFMSRSSRCYFSFVCMFLHMLSSRQKERSHHQASGLYSASSSALCQFWRFYK